MPQQTDKGGEHKGSYRGSQLRGSASKYSPGWCLPDVRRRNSSYKLMTDCRGTQGLTTHTHTHKSSQKYTLICIQNHCMNTFITYTYEHTFLLVAISNHIRPCPTLESSGVLAVYKDTRFVFAVGNSKLTSAKFLRLPNKVGMLTGKVLLFVICEKYKQKINKYRAISRSIPLYQNNRIVWHTPLQPN